MKANLKKYFRKKVLEPVLNLLQQGISPEKLSLTVSLGAVIGVIPVVGVTTVLSTLLALRLRLNVAVTVLMGYILQPVQLLLLVPFIKAGIFVSGFSAMEFTFDEMWLMLKQDWLEALNKFWLANVLGLGAWLVTAFPLGLLIYYSTLPVFRKVVAAPVETQE